MKAILAIDPGTKCGWGLLVAGEVVASGVWDLRSSRHAGGGMRFVRLRGFLDSMADAFLVQGVAYEEVRRHAGTDAAHVYGGIIATITAWCEQKQIPYQGIPVGTVKKVATGKGNANKHQMAVAAGEKWPDFNPEDDNEVDARWIAVAAKGVFAALL